MISTRDLSKRYGREKGKIKQKFAREDSHQEKLELLKLAEQYLVEVIIKGVFNKDLSIDKNDNFIDKLQEDGAPFELFICATVGRFFEPLLKKPSSELQPVMRIMFEIMCEKNFTDLDTIFAYGCRMPAITEDENIKAKWRTSIQALMLCDVDPSAKISAASVIFEDKDLSAFEFLEKHQQHEVDVLHQMSLLINKKHHKPLDAKEDNPPGTKNAVSIDIDKALENNEIAKSPTSPSNRFFSAGNNVDASVFVDKENETRLQAAGM